MVVRIDLSLLVEVHHGQVFGCIADDVKQALAYYPDLLRRLEDSLDATFAIGGEKGSPQGHLQASLTALVGIEEAQKNPGVSGRRLKSVHRLNTTGHPLLCVVREMRNAEVHLAPAQFASEERNLLWGRREDPDSAMPVQWRVHWIDNLDMRRFSALYNLRHYDGAEFANSLAWFDRNQKSWGIVEMVYRAMQHYGCELAAHAKNNSQP